VDVQQLQNLYCLLRGVGFFPQLAARQANCTTKNETNRRMPIVSKAEELVKFFAGTIYILGTQPPPQPGVYEEKC
jgi:hypothetical protein